MSRLGGATILITGASSGIGRELARQVASRAGALVLVARRQARLDTLRADLLAQHPQLTVHTQSCDLGDAADLERLIERLPSEVGPIDVLINNAGLGDQGLFDHSDWARQRQLVAVDVVAPLRLTHALVPAMVARGRGGVLNVGSGAGVAFMPGATSYVASKHFIDGLSENLRLDLEGTGVTVTQALPGPVDTEFDSAANIEGGLGGPPAALRISAEQCARESLAAFERGAARVFPGAVYRLLMRVQALLPRVLMRWVGRSQARRMRETLRDG